MRTTEPTPAAAGPGSSALARLLERLDSLPTIPLIARQVGEIVADPAADARRVAQVMRSDQSLTAKVLKLANSSYYGIPGGVTDVTRAISFLGFNTLYQLVLSVSVISTLHGRNVGELSPRSLWQHAIGCGLLAEQAAKQLRLPDTQLFFTAGLLHDIGKVALLQVAPFQFQEAVAQAHRQAIALSDAESYVGLPTHGMVGSRLAERWRFPMALQLAIARERLQTPEAQQTVSPGMRPVVDITTLADALVRRAHFGDPGDDVVPEVPDELLQRLNLSRGDTNNLVGELFRAVERSRLLLELVGG